MQTITDLEWMEKYKPTHDEVIPDHADVVGTAANRVWTQVEGDNGSIVIVAGFHVVNYLGYWITQNPHNFDVEVVDEDTPMDEDDEKE